MPYVFVLWVIVAAAVLVGVAFVATQEFSGLDEVGHDEPDIGLPTDRLLRAEDVRRLRFRVVSGLQGGLRGYRFSDVDATMAKVEEALLAAEVARAQPVQPGQDDQSAQPDSPLRRGTRPPA